LDLIYCKCLDLNALIESNALNDIYKTLSTCICMSFIKEELDNEFKSIGFKNQRRSLKTLKQVGTSNKKRDESRKALMPGKRVSKSGKVYWETRKNRSDAPLKKL